MSKSNYIKEIAQMIRAELPPDKRPEDLPDSDQLFNMFALLVKVKGIKVTAVDVHNALSTWATNISLSYAQIVTFDKLSEFERGENYTCLKAIRAVAQRLQKNSREIERQAVERIRTTIAEAREAADSQWWRFSWVLMEIEQLIATVDHENKQEKAESLND